ncbi:hypothetical protein PGT21_020875 [Puccinia graminis f. sp. tritici]|uniref:U1-type domain-containing protein n=1 Tax=Puccinia graminis f. sp. tritici TaxID=56615 RepID=A0A5B0QBR6_PUCGR|nr:hypothetical protein PGT21_020875 [Puccinia graminis f. sp. tritici]
MAPVFDKDYTVANGLYVCNLCPLATGAKNWRKHISSLTHKLHVQKRIDEANCSVEDRPPGGTEGGGLDRSAMDDRRDDVVEDNAHDERVWQHIERFLALNNEIAARDPLSASLDEFLDHLESTGGIRGTPVDPDSGGQADWQALLETALSGIETDKDIIVEDPRPILRTDLRSDRVDSSPWFPFKSKLDLIGSLIIGHTHSLLSRALYTKIRAILTICDLTLPAYATVRTSRKRIRGLLGSAVNKAVSVFDVPCYALSAKRILARELANPLVSRHLDYYPEWTNGLNISKFSQGDKWLRGMSREHRPQMCESKGKHFYIFEPVQLLSHAVVIPMFFFMDQSALTARCWEIKEEDTTLVESTIEGDSHARLSIHVQTHLDFSDARLLSVRVDAFDLDYSEIRWEDGRTLVEACAGRLSGFDGLTSDEVLLPNPWRTKAQNKILRNIPITLYSDDTSGNVSKQFNKHISFYFTLSGLPPHMANQEFNCHFLATSNLAGVCEVAEQIVEELNDMASVGFEAYDDSIQQSVWVASTVLCFLADSPMHAEITSTPNPGASNNPCRICHLSVKLKRLKRTRTYIRKFSQRGPLGSAVAGRPRSWAESRRRCHELFGIATTKSMNQFTIKGKEFGLKDTILTRLLTESTSDAVLRTKMASLAVTEPKRLYNPFLELLGFDGVLDTPVELLHVFLLGVVKYLARDLVAGVTGIDEEHLIGRLRSFSCVSLNIDSFKPRYLIKHIKSLVGRDFKILLQSAPFAFAHLMSEEQRSIWLSLCKMAPFIFQTKINHLDTYLENLKLHINIFLHNMIKSSAQWVNKPKLHMLLHLPDSIRRFGPASLFSTEKFESYNGVLRNASVHSNKLAPGRDLATSFDNFACIRSALGGGQIWNHVKGTTRAVSDLVGSVFRENTSIQRAMGYNWETSNPLPAEAFPFKTRCPLGQAKVQSPPPEVVNVHPGASVTQVAQIQINKHDRVAGGVFVAIGDSLDGVLGVALVGSLWEVRPERLVSSLMCWVQIFDIGGVDEYYQMREIIRSDRWVLVNAKFIQGCLNVQHNCHLFSCELEKIGLVHMEKEVTSAKVWAVQHMETTNYIINSASLHDPHLHQRVAALPVYGPQDSDWVNATQAGLDVWNEGLLPVNSDEEAPWQEPDADGETDSEYGPDDDSSIAPEGSELDADGETDSEGEWSEALNA